MRKRLLSKAWGTRRLFLCSMLCSSLLLSSAPVFASGGDIYDDGDWGYSDDGEDYSDDTIEDDNTSDYVGEDDNISDDVIDNTSDDATDDASSLTTDGIKVGDNIIAKEDNGTIYITGTGDMYDNNSHFTGYCGFGEGYDYFNIGNGKTYDHIISKDTSWFRDSKATRAEFSDGIEYIGANTFNKCWHLFREMGSNHSYYLHMYEFPQGHSGVETISEVKLGSSVKTIGEGAFSGLTGLSSIKLPDSVETISSYAFFNTPLTNIELPYGLTTLGEYCFYGTDLSNIVVPGGISKIGETTFAGANKLKKVTISQGVAFIEAGSFGDNITLKVLSYDVNISDGAVGDNSVIECYSGSTADEFAKRNNLKIRYLDKKPSRLDKPTVKAGKRKMTVTVNPKGEADGYEIRYSSKITMKNAKVKAGSKAVITGLKKGRKYYIQARSYLTNAMEKNIYSTWSDIAVAKIK